MPGYMSCPLCIQNTLSDVQELQKKVASALSRSLHCPICSASLHGLPSLHLHLATHIPIPGSLDCQNAASPEQIPSLEKLDIRDEANLPANSTNRGGHTISSSEGENASAQMKVVQFNCDFCGLVFSSEYFLNQHKHIVHSGANEFEVECKQCKSRFRNIETYREHVKEIHSDRMYICDHCPKAFKIKGGLLVHTRMVHDQSSPSSCVVCNKSFSSRARRGLHERRCHKIESQGKNVQASSPKSVDKKSDLGEAKSCLENLIQSTNQHLSSNSSSPQHSLFDSENLMNEVSNKKLDSNRSDPTGLGNQTTQISMSPSSMNRNNSVAYNKKAAVENVPQVVERQLSCPPKIVNCKDNGIENVRSIQVGSGTDNWNHKDMNNFHESKHSQLENKRQTASNENSPFASIFFSNFSNSLPRYNEFHLSNFPISSLISSSVSVQIPSPMNETGKLQQLDNNIITSGKYFDPTNNQEDKLNQNSQFGKSSESESLMNEVTNNKLNLNMSEQTESGNQTNVPADYTITLPQALNLNSIPFLDNMNTPTSLITKMKNTLDKLSSSEPSTDVLQKSEQSDQNQNVLNQDIKKYSKVPTKKNSPPNKGSENKQWECDECKKSFTTKYFLKKHKRLHTGETPYACEKCGKTFTFQQSYHKHVFYHSDDKPHICPHCNRAFKEMSTLHNHVRIHTGEKPFVCPTCGKSFRQRVSYLVHQRIHTGILPYRCDICSRAFRYKVSLRSHKCEGRNVEFTSSPPSGSKSCGTDVQSSTSSPQGGCQFPQNGVTLSRLEEVNVTNSNQKSDNTAFQDTTLCSYQQHCQGENSQIQDRICLPIVGDHHSYPSMSGSSVTNISTNSIAQNCSEAQSFNSKTTESLCKLRTPYDSNQEANEPSSHSQQLNIRFDDLLIPMGEDNPQSSRLKSGESAKSSILGSQDSQDFLENASNHPISINKFDQKTLPTINLSEGLSPMNLAEDLDNDAFLRNLFS